MNIVHYAFALVMHYPFTVLLTLLGCALLLFLILLCHRIKRVESILSLIYIRAMDQKQKEAIERYTH